VVGRVRLRGVCGDDAGDALVNSKIVGEALPFWRTHP
jgi:hypothetical protein